MASYRAEDDHPFPTPGEEDGSREPGFSVLEVASAGTSLRGRMTRAATSAVVAPIPVILVVLLVFALQGMTRTGLVVADAFAAVIAVWVLLGGMVFGTTPLAVYAGARAVGDGAGRVVRFSELTRIALRQRRSGPWLQLEDRFGGAVDLPLDLVTLHQALWNLVHLGLRHGAATGAEVAEEVRTRLRLRSRDLTPGGPDRGVPPPRHPLAGLGGAPRAPVVVAPWSGRRAPVVTSYSSTPENEEITLTARRRHGRCRVAVAATCDGCGPTLLLAAVVAAALAVAALVTGVGDLGVRVSSVGWFIGLGLVATVVLHWFTQRSTTVRVGHRTLADSEGGVVDLGALCRIRVARRPRAGHVLWLRDAHGGRLPVPLGLLTAHPPAWDLVHRGMRLCAPRAAVDDATRRFLRLDPVGSRSVHPPGR